MAFAALLKDPEAEVRAAASNRLRGTISECLLQVHCMYTQDSAPTLLSAPTTTQTLYHHWEEWYYDCTSLQPSPPPHPISLKYM